MVLQDSGTSNGRSLIRIGNQNASKHFSFLQFLQKTIPFHRSVHLSIDSRQVLPKERLSTVKSNVTQALHTDTLCELVCLSFFLVIVDELHKCSEI